MTIEEERKAFEVWHNKEYADKLEWNNAKGEYKDYIDEAMWQSWLASANREGYKLVPKYHKENIRDALIIACDIKDDEQRFEDSLNYVHKAMIGACDDH